jgi:hypothetical protein
LDRDYDSKKFYFISVRDPLDLYISLFSYGCEAKGNLFRRLHNKGLGVLYDGTWEGFQYWLEFILDPENAHFLERRYSKSDGGVSGMVGYQSYRVLGLAIPHGIEELSKCGNSSDIRAVYESRSVVSYAIKYEQFCEDICTLLRDKLRYSVSNIEEAVHYVQTQKARNPSDRIDRYESTAVISKRLRRLLEDREWLLHESFGY